MEFDFIQVIKALVLPPGVLLLMLIVAFWLQLQGKKSGRQLLLLTLLGFYLLSIPALNYHLAKWVEPHQALSSSLLQRGGNQAIVVIGAGIRPPASEYGGQLTVSSSALTRLRYAAQLARKTNLPLLVSGGQVLAAYPISEAELMADILREEFQVPVRWVEKRSRNTAENAAFSHDLLAGSGIERIILVTQAMHMKRAVDQFERAGFRVSAAPVDFMSDSGVQTVADYLPSAKALLINAALLHELLGQCWYRIRYGR